VRRDVDDLSTAATGIAAGLEPAAAAVRDRSPRAAEDLGV
jgi:hypothetical protein